MRSSKLIDQIQILKDQIDIATKPFQVKNEIDFELLSKDEDALANYRQLSFQLMQAEAELERINKTPQIKTSPSNEIKSESPPIHYTWIGPKAHVPGQDIGGPIRMAKLNQHNPITFYCLDKEVSYYASEFKDQNIKVQSVEDFVTKKLSDPNPKIRESAKQMQEILDTCLKKEDRGSIRDRTTVKVAFNFFLLQTMGGYTLDTNVIPEQDKKISLPPIDSVTVPVIIPKTQAKPGIERKNLECWMIASPSQNPVAQEMFGRFYALWQKSEEFRTENSLEKYHAHMGGVIMTAIYEQFLNSKVKLFKTESTNSIYVDVPELGLRKTYSNTHKYNMQSKYEPGLFGMKDEKLNEEPNEIFFLAYSKNIPQLKIFIESKGDANDQIKKTTSSGFYEGETPLHMAVRAKAPAEVIKILLDASANLDLAAKYPGKEVSAREMLSQNKEYLVVLKDHESRKPRR